MRLIRDKAKTKSRILLGVFVGALLLLLSFFAIHSHASLTNAEALENDVKVWPNSELKYYLTVKYDGVDKNGVQSTDEIRADIQGGVVEVSDKLPDGLEFVGFETTGTGKIGAVKRDDPATSCVGRVIDDTKEERVDAGTWNGAHTEFYYHGLHYNATTRMVTFRATSIQAGCDLNVGIITRTPELGDALRMDFFNTANVKEGLINKNSNTVHVWMGREEVLLHRVTYTYSGEIPDNAPSLPDSEQYVRGANVGLALEPTLDGYTFSGWSTSDATIVDGSFVMPDMDVTLVGMFTKNPEEPEYTVSYEITGDIPEDYQAPRTKSYKENAVVILDSAESGDIVGDYIFSGWSTEDVTILDGSFNMPDHDVVITGSFELREFKISYYFIGEVLPPNAPSLLPPSQTYRAGEEVTIANNPSAEGYRFSGWYSDATFTMPANDLQIEGEWTVVVGTFAPTISIEIIDKPEEDYLYRQTVRFKIIVTNTANFAITDVYILENLPCAKFVSGEGYTISADSVAVIPFINANGNIELYAEYYIANNEDATITNEVEISGARATADNYEIDSTQDYTDAVSFDVDHWEELPVVTGINIRNIILFIMIIALGLAGIVVIILSRKRKAREEDEE